MASPARAESLSLDSSDLKVLTRRAFLLREEGIVLDSKGKYKRAVQKALRSAELFASLGNKVQKARSLGKAAHFCIHARHHRAAAYYSWKGLRALGLDNDEVKNFFLGTLARIYRELWLMSRAEKYYRLYLRLSMQEANTLQVGYGNLGLGLNYLQQGQYEAALRSTRKAQTVFREMGNYALEFSALLNVSCIYNAMGDHDRAQEILEPLLAGTLPDNTVTVFNAYDELARTYLAKGYMNKFREARDKAEEYASRSKDLVVLGRMVMLDAEWYAAQGQRRKAIHTLRKAIVVLRNHGTPNDLRPAEDLLMRWVKGEMLGEEDPEADWGHVASACHPRGLRRSGVCRSRS